MKIAASILIALGGALPIAGIYRGWRSTRRDLGQLTDLLGRIDVVNRDPNKTIQEKHHEKLGILMPKSNFGRNMYAFEWTQRLILEQAMADLRGPVRLTLAGLFLGAVGGVWALWL